MTVFPYLRDRYLFGYFNKCTCTYLFQLNYFALYIIFVLHYLSSCLFQAREARRLKEFLEDYDDERDDIKYYK